MNLEKKKKNVYNVNNKSSSAWPPCVNNVEKVNMTTNENFKSTLIVNSASFSLSPVLSRCTRCGRVSRGHRFPA